MAVNRYHHPGVAAPPAWSMGTPQNEKKIKNPTPGPGSYDLDTTPTKYSIEFGIKHKNVYQKGQDAPGPGQYDNQVKRFQTPEYSMRAKTAASLFARNVNTPGPGNYNPNVRAYKKKMPAYSIQISKEKKELHKPVPGPGTYSISYKEGVSAHFPIQKRLTENRTKSPGPAAYTTTQSFSELPSWSFKKDHRVKATQSNSKAAPGSYEYKPGFSKTSYTILPRRDPTALPQGRESPGPGAYSPEAAKSKKNLAPDYGVESANKLITEKNLRVKKVPGPGDYTPVKTLARTQGGLFGTGGRINHAKDMTPAPSAYSVKSSISQGLKWSFSEEKRLPKQKTIVPGPGKYADAQDQKLENAPQYTFSRAQRVRSNKIIKPGPGSYDFSSTNSGLGTSFSQEIRSKPPKKFGCDALYNIPATLPTMPTQSLKSSINK